MKIQRLLYSYEISVWSVVIARVGASKTTIMNVCYFDDAYFETALLDQPAYKQTFIKLQISASVLLSFIQLLLSLTFTVNDQRVYSLSGLSVRDLKNYCTLHILSFLA